MGLLDLPTEMLQHILSYLSGTALLRFRATSHAAKSAGSRCVHAVRWQGDDASVMDLGCAFSHATRLFLMGQGKKSMASVVSFLHANRGLLSRLEELEIVFDGGKSSQQVALDYIVGACRSLRSLELDTSRRAPLVQLPPTLTSITLHSAFVGSYDRSVSSLSQLPCLRSFTWRYDDLGGGDLDDVGVDLQHTTGLSKLSSLSIGVRV